VLEKGKKRKDKEKAEFKGENISVVQERGIIIFLGESVRKIRYLVQWYDICTCSFKLIHDPFPPASPRLFTYV
jgi:hypothetical protein